jgi:hypothetical protein
MTKARDLANGGFGLVLVKPSTVVGGTDNGKGTVTISGASTLSLNGVFNSTYTHYRVMLSIFGSTSTNYRLRFGTSNSAYSGAEYFFVNYLQNTASSQTTSSAGSQTSWFIGSHGSTSNLRDVNTIEIGNPNVAARTTAVWSGLSRDLSRMQSGAGFIEQDTQYTDLFLVPDSGTISGTISVYGYNK